MDDELRRTVLPDGDVPPQLSEDVRQRALDALHHSRRSDRRRVALSGIAAVAGVVAIVGLLVAALPRGDRADADRARPANSVSTSNPGLTAVPPTGTVEPGRTSLGTAKNGRPAGVTRTAINLPPLTDTTRPQVVGRQVLLAKRVRDRVEALNEAFAGCMLANGATRNRGTDGTEWFTDPGSMAQTACAAPLASSQAYGESFESRIAHLAQMALTLAIRQCLADDGSGSLEAASNDDFATCVAAATRLIEETGSVRLG